MGIAQAVPISFNLIQFTFYAKYPGPICPLQIFYIAQFFFLLA